MLREGSEIELAALLSNPSVDTKLLESIYARSGLIATLSDDRWRDLVNFTVENPKLVIDDGHEFGPDIGHMAIHQAILKLPAIAPVTPDWLLAVRRLLEQLNPDNVSWPKEPITPILERWANVAITDEWKWLSEGHYTGLTFVDETRCLIAALYGRQLKDIQGKYSTEVLSAPNASDVTLRCAYYGRGELNEETMKAGFARDGDAYTFAVLCNSVVFHRPKLRKLLEDEQLFRDLLRGIYLRRCAQVHEKWPKFDPAPGL